MGGDFACPEDQWRRFKMAEARNNEVLDTGLQYLGTVYAKALLAVTEKTGKSEAVVQELESLVDDVLVRLPKLDAALSSPRVSLERKEALLDQAFSKSMSPQLLQFLKVVIRRGRFNCIRALRRSAQHLLNELRRRVEVHVTTAEPVDSATKDLIATTLQRALKRDIDLKLSVKPEVLGGILIRVGDTVYDGSLANQLARLRQDLISSASMRLRTNSERFVVAN